MMGIATIRVAVAMSMTVPVPSVAPTFTSDLSMAMSVAGGSEDAAHDQIQPQPAGRHDKHELAIDVTRGEEAIDSFVQQKRRQHPYHHHTGQSPDDLGAVVAKGKLLGGPSFGEVERGDAHEEGRQVGGEVGRVG